MRLWVRQAGKWQESAAPNSMANTFGACEKPAPMPAIHPPEEALEAFKQSGG